MTARFIDITAIICGDPCTRQVRAPTDRERKGEGPHHVVRHRRDRGKTMGGRVELLHPGEELIGLTEREKNNAMHFFWRMGLTGRSERMKNGMFRVRRLA